MNEEIFEKILPQEYLYRYLSKEIRPDGRKLLELRNLKIIMNFIPTFEGCCILTLGDTNILCTVESDLIDKTISKFHDNSFSHEDYNFLDIKIEIGKYEIEDGDIIERNKFESYLEIYFQNLFCPILKEKINELNIGLKLKQWSLKIKSKVLKNNGDLLVALYFAIFFSLFSAQLPTLSKEIENLFNYEEKQRLALKPENFYFPITFAQLFSKYIVIDPSYAEESLSNYILTIFINLKTNESIIHKINGKSIEYKKILEFEKESLVILEKIKNKINMFFENPSKTFEILL